MRTHPAKSRRVEKTEVTLGVYYRGQLTCGEPDEYLSLERCRELKKSGLGTFINRGRAFQRFDSSQPHDTTHYKTTGRRGASLKIDEPIPIPGCAMQLGMMTRFVIGDKSAIAAVKAWRGVTLQVKTVSA